MAGVSGTNTTPIELSVEYDASQQMPKWILLP